MAYRLTFVCVAVCLLQTITSQYINVPSPNIFTSANTGTIINAANPLANANQYSGAGIGRSGVLSVTSTSPLYPAGLSVYAENIVLEGPLAVSGQLPFLGAIALEGALESYGQGLASCGCGDGGVGIYSEGIGGRV